MAHRTSSQTGPLSSSSTWGGAAAPGNGDTLEISATHVVTVDVNATVGSSPSDTTTNAILINSSGELKVATGVTFQVRGNVRQNAGASVPGGIFRLQQGATLEVDASQAGTPGTNYKWDVRGGETGPGGLPAVFITEGIAGSRCTVRSNAGGGNFQLLGQSGAYDDCNCDCNYTDFLRVGDVGIDSLNCHLDFADYVNNAGYGANFKHCTFDACGTLRITMDSGIDVLYSDNRILANCQGTVLTGSNTLSGGVGRDFLRNSFNVGLTLKYVGANIEDNFFGGGVNDPASTAWASFTRNFIEGIDFPLTTSAGANYFFTDNNDGNPHIVLPGNGVTLHASIIEYSGEAGFDGGNCYYASSSTGCTLSECVVTKNHGENAAAGAVTFVAAGGCDVYRNSLYSSDYSGGILLGDGSGNTGTYPHVKGNIFWIGLGEGTGTAAHAIDTTTDNIITPGQCTHNLCINLASTRYQGDYPTTQPGASDTVVTGVNVLTILHNPYRNIGTWAVERGSIAVAYADQKDDALAYMLADPSLVLALVTHVKAGSAIINPSYKGLAHDGFDHGPAWRPLPLEPATADGDEVTFADWNHTLDTGVVPDAADFVFKSGRTCAGVTVNSGSLVLTGVSPAYDGSIVGDYVTYTPGSDPITADDTAEAEMWAATVNDETEGGGGGFQAAWAAGSNVLIGAAL